MLHHDMYLHPKSIEDLDYEATVTLTTITTTITTIITTTITITTTTTKK